MYTTVFIAALGILAILPTAASQNDYLNGMKNDPVYKYLRRMCYPWLTSVPDGTSWDPPELFSYDLSRSTFPCEQLMYTEISCRANSTTPLDYSAEQQCLCKGSYFSLVGACNSCFNVHGSEPIPAEEWTSTMSSVKTMECASAVPTQSFNNLLGEVFGGTATGEPKWTNYTLNRVDQFPNQTAVSNYYTATGTTSLLGDITGSATGRATQPGPGYFGTKYDTEPTASGTSSSPMSSTQSTPTVTQGAALPTTATPSPAATSTQSGNGARTSHVGASGCLVALMFGAVALL